VGEMDMWEFKGRSKEISFFLEGKIRRRASLLKIYSKLDIQRKKQKRRK